MAGIKEQFMTADEIQEMFIRAAEIDRKLPRAGSPAQLKAMDLGYVHTFAEMNHWDAADLHAANWAWLDPKKLRVTTNDVGIWEVAMEVMKLVPSENKRRALWAWARSEAGGPTFSKWCRSVEGISRQLGDWRRRSAIECISLAFARKRLQHNDNDKEPSFTNSPEISDKHANIAEDVTYWRDADAKPKMSCKFDESLRDFSWAIAQNERRKQREAERRKRQAA